MEVLDLIKTLINQKKKKRKRKKKEVVQKYQKLILKHLIAHLIIVLLTKKTKIYSVSTSSWYSGIAKKPVDKFAVEFGNGCSPVMVGYILKDKLNQNSSNYNSAYCYYVSSSYLYGSNMVSGASYSGCSYNSGTILGCEFFRKKRINGLL